jgi:hypothetical protein
VQKVQADQRGIDLPVADGVGHLAPERARQLGHVLGIGGKKTREMKREVVSDGRAHLALRAHVDGDGQEKWNVGKPPPLPQLGHRPADVG